MNSKYRLFLRYGIFIMVVLATIYFLFVVREVLLTFIFASFLAYILFRPVLFIEKWGIPRIWAILLLYLILIAIFSTLLALAIPGLVRELGELGKLLPGYAEEASDLAKQLDNTSMPARFNEVVRENIGKIESLIYS
ncbi:MAG TPA: AI-2E family transporter, partial [Syntrophomonadaceae bacterium]|nr:AI-2E family transporter [Syntrophomonadaceae bacterium]